MTKRQDHALSAYLTTLAFFQRAEGPISPEVPAIVHSLTATVGEIVTLRGIASQLSKESAALALKAPVEKMREEHMLPLSRLARRVFVGESAILAAVRVPHKHASIDAIVDAAFRMVEALAPHRRVLKAARMDPLRLNRLKSEAKSIRKRGRETPKVVASRRVPTRRLEELFASAHRDVLSLQALVIACRSITPGEKTRFAASSRIGKRRGRPTARQQDAARRKKERDA